MSTTTRVFAGGPSEGAFGFAQAVALDGKVWVAGQVGRDNATGVPVDPPTLEAQLEQALLNVEACLQGAGLERSDATTLTVYLTADVDLDADRAKVDAALANFLGDARPAVEIVQIAALARPEFWVEIVATVVPDGSEHAVERTLRPYSGELAAEIPARGEVAGPELRLAGHFGHGDDLGAALEEALADLKQTLTEGGLDTSHMVAEQVHVRAPIGPDDFPRLAAAHSAEFGAIRPAATVLILDELPVADARVMVTGVAHREARTD